MSRNLVHLRDRLESILAEIDLVQSTAERRVGELVVDAKEVELLISVLTGELKTVKASQPDGDVPPSDGKRTIQDMAVEVIADASGGVTALEILDQINSRFKASLKRTSLSPQLSRLKADGVIELRGKRWFIVKPRWEFVGDSPARDALFAPRSASITEPHDDASGTDDDLLVTNANLSAFLLGRPQ
jgi:hypothetical protein